MTLELVRDLVHDLARYRAGPVPAISEVPVVPDPDGGPRAEAVPILAEEPAKLPDPFPQLEV